eukprot:g18517.t1
MFSSHFCSPRAAVGVQKRSTCAPLALFRKSILANGPFRLRSPCVNGVHVTSWIHLLGVNITFFCILRWSRCF